MSTSAEAMTDDTPKTTPENPRAEPDAIRSAFVARTVTVTAAPGGLADATAASTSITLRGAYLAHLGDGATTAVGAAPTGVDGLLRSAYAARLAAPSPGAASGRPRRAKSGRAKPVRAKTVRAKLGRRAKPARAAKTAKRATAKVKKAAAKPKPKVKAKAKPARAAAKRGIARKAARRRRR
jgi:hypothetical protein